jgi:hypothetical protein
MASMFEECTTKDTHFVMHFFLAEGLSAKDIHKEMFPVYSEKCLLRKEFLNWVNKFSHGCLKVADDETKVRKWLRDNSQKAFMLQVLT